MDKTINLKLVLGFVCYKEFKTYIMHAIENLMWYMCAKNYGNRALINKNDVMVDRCVHCQQKYFVLCV